MEISVHNGRVDSSKIYKILGYSEHRNLKDIVIKNYNSFAKFGDVRGYKISSSSKGGRPTACYLLNLNQLLLLTSLSRGLSGGRRADILELIVRSYSESSLLAVLNLISSMDTEEMESDRYVYVARESVSGRYKIGISKDPERRIKELNTGNPEKLNLVHAYLATEKGYKSEALAHAVYESERISGEWFSSTIDIKELPSYNILHEDSPNCDCIDCTNYDSVMNSVDECVGLSRDCLISKAMSDTDLSFPVVANCIDALEDTGVICFS